MQKTIPNHKTRQTAEERSHSARNGSKESHLMSTQLDRAENHLATAGERKEPTSQPHGLIPIRRN